MIIFSRDSILEVVRHFRDAVASLFGASITLGLANHLITGDFIALQTTPHVHDIATGAVLYLATAGLTAFAIANIALIVGKARGE